MSTDCWQRLLSEFETHALEWDRVEQTYHPDDPAIHGIQRSYEKAKAEILLKLRSKV